MTTRLVASGFMLLVLAGCGWSGGQDSTPGPPALRATSQLPPAKEAAKSVSRSLWGVVPAAPKRKQDLRPELIKGSAVAVADDALLTSCSVLGNRKQVGLIRHNKYRMAKLLSADPRGEVCVLRVPDGPLNVAAGYRDPADLRLGEPVYALMNQTSSDVALVQGELTGLAAQEGGPRLETSLVLPADVQSGVLIDGYGNLVGVAAPRPGTAGGVTMTAVPGRLAPQLASLDAPSPTVPLPVAAPRAVPVAATSPPPMLVLQLDDDRDTDRQSIGVAQTAPAAPATEMAATSTTVDQEDTTSTVSRSEGRTSASRSDNGSRSGRGAGGSTANGATGNTSTDTSDAATEESATGNAGTDTADAGPNDGGVDNGNTTSDHGTTFGTGSTGSPGGFDLGATLDRLAGTGASVARGFEAARSQALTRSTITGTTTTGRLSSSFASSSASGPETSADDDGGKSNGGRGGRVNSGKGSRNSGKGSANSKGSRKGR